MDVYYSPLACSMATRITLYEAGETARFIEVDSEAKRALGGDEPDYLKINPLGLVPAIRDNGEVLTENAAVLQYVAGRYPDAKLMPLDGMARAKLQQWLCFIGTELHKALFIPLFDKKLPEAAKARALELGENPMAYLNGYLTGREFLLDRFSIADAYLFTVLNWKIAVPVDLAKWPAVLDYYRRMKARPSVARALSEEHALYAEEQKRKQAA